MDELLQSASLLHGVTAAVPSDVTRVSPPQLCEFSPAPSSPQRPEDDDGTSSSSSSSDSGSSESSDAGDEALLKGREQGSAIEQAIVEGRKVFQHSGTKTLHFQAPGSNSRSFICGRVMGPGHRPFLTKLCSERWVCKQCLAGRPLRDRGSLTKALDLVISRRG